MGDWSSAWKSPAAGNWDQFEYEEPQNNWNDDGYGEEQGDPVVEENMKLVFLYLDEAAQHAGWAPDYLAMVKTLAPKAFARSSLMRTELENCIIARLQVALDGYRSSLNEEVTEAVQLFQNADEFREQAEGRLESVEEELAALETSTAEAQAEYDKIYQAKADAEWELQNADAKYVTAKEDLRKLGLNLSRLKNAYEKEFLPKRENRRLRARGEAMTTGLIRAGADPVLAELVPMLLDGEDSDLRTDMLARVAEAFETGIAKMTAQQEEADEKGDRWVDEQIEDLKKSLGTMETQELAAQNVLQTLQTKQDKLLARQSLYRLAIDDPAAYKVQLASDVDAAKDKVKAVGGVDFAVAALDFATLGA